MQIVTLSCSAAVGSAWVPKTAAEFPLCMAMVVRRRRYCRRRDSPVALQSRQSSSPTRSSTAFPSTLDVSTAKGTKKWLESRCAYLTVASFSLPTCAATQLHLASQQWECVRVHT